MERFPITKLMSNLFKDWLDQEIKNGNIEQPSLDVYSKMLQVEWVKLPLESMGISPNPWHEETTISQGCEMETKEIKCNFCEKEKSVVAYMVEHNGSAICASCVMDAQEKILENARATFMQLDKANRYIKLLEEKSGILSID